MAQLGQYLRAWRNSRYSHHRLVTWLAVLALAAQVLVPFTQALASDRDQGLDYQLICTATGVQQILIGDDGQPIEPQDATPCPFCLTHAMSALLQPEVLSELITTHRTVSMVFAHVSRIDRADTWRGASQPSRAPPQFI